MADFKFQDFRIECKAAMTEAIAAGLEEAAGELESQAKANTRVKTGQTKRSWEHRVVENTAYIGSNYENAIWEEFGTGEYALEGNGRRGGWFYEDDNGDGHFTYGKKPNRALWNAYVTKKAAIKAHLENLLKGGM